MPWVGFEPTISAGERPKAYALDRAATGIGMERSIKIKSACDVKKIILFGFFFFFFFFF